MTHYALEIKNLYKRFGETTTASGVCISVATGEFFTLLGPSGSGKSTILRIVAGLEQADHGKIIINQHDVSNTPPWQRGLGMVFQQYANFPHMDVASNISYGLRRSGMTKTEIAGRVIELLELVGLNGFENRRVTQLSGGEQQRVAIARALAPRPTLLLLDEPLAALDEKIRRGMQSELRNIQQATETTFIYVTHDQEEALTLSDRVAVLNRGKCVQCDDPKRIFRFPRTKFVADFFRGCNVLEAVVEPSAKGYNMVLAGQFLALKKENYNRTKTQPIAIRGESVLLGDEAKDGDLILSTNLEKITYRGLYSDYQLVLPDGQRMSALLTHRHDLVEGQDVLLGVRAADVILLEED